MDNKLTVRDLYLIKHIELLKSDNQKIILYGASSCGQECINLLEDSGIKIFAFIDSCSDKWDTYFFGIPVYSPKWLKKTISEENIVVIITSNYVKDIYNYLEKNNIIPNYLFTYLGLAYALMMNHDSPILEEKWKKQFNLILQNYEKTSQYKIESQSILHITDMNIQLAYQKFPVLIYQPAKVGSTSLYNSLKEIGIGCFHFHTFYTPLNHFKKEYREMSNMFLKTVKEKEKVKIIALVRDPIARDISAFFHTLDRPFFYYQKSKDNDFINKCCKAIEKAFVNDGLGKLQDNVWNIPYIENKLGYEFNWFNRNIKRDFNIDIYSYPFDTIQGYTIIKENNIDILLLQLEKLQSLNHVIENFLNITNFTLKNYNLGKDKIYQFAYKELLNKIKIPEKILNFYYDNNKGMQHFYSLEDIKHLKQKWL